MVIVMNYNDDKEDRLFYFVEPKPVVEDERRLSYLIVNRDPAYARYWSNNWRKLHGLPLRRKFERWIYVVPQVLDDETYAKMCEFERVFKEGSE